MSFSLKNIGSFCSHAHGLVRGDHLCKFYEDKQALTTSVCDFIIPGLTRDEGIIIIATADHLASVRAGLERRSIDVNKALAHQQLLFLDAEQTLMTFMEDDHPNAEKFQIAIGSVLSEMQVRHKKIRAYGEMVDLLFKHGNHAATMALEELWNSIAQTFSFSLLCGYSASSFKNQQESEAYESICLTHSHLISKGELALIQTANI